MSHATQLHDRRYLDDYLQMIHRAGLPSHVKAEVCQQVQQTVLTTVKWTLEQALREEVTAYLGLARYEHVPQSRTPEQTRSGTYAKGVTEETTQLVVSDGAKGQAGAQAGDPGRGEPHLSHRCRAGNSRPGSRLPRHVGVQGA